MLGEVSLTRHDHQAAAQFGDGLAIAEELRLRPLAARCREGLARLRAAAGAADG